MRKTLLILLCLACVFSINCTQTISKEKAKGKLESLFNISISDNIKISNYEVTSDIHGHYTEDFSIHFTKEEFNKIFSKVRPQKGKIFNDGIYWYSVTNENKRISATFEPDKNIINYSYFEQ